MASLVDLIKYYQNIIEKHAQDEETVLRAIDELYNMDVKVQHLQETGVGRTVNALRKEPGLVGKAARTLVYKWKLMVAAEESDQEGDHDDCPTENEEGDQRDSDDENNSSQKLPKVNGHHSGSKRKYHSSEEEEPDMKRTRLSQSSDSEDCKEKVYVVQTKTEPPSDNQSSDSHSDTDDDSESSEEDRKPVTIKTEPVDKYTSKHSHRRHSNHHKTESSSSKRSHGSSEHKSSKHHSSESRHSSEKSKSSNRSKEKHSNEKENSSDKKHRDHKSDKEKTKIKEESKSSSKHNSDKHNSGSHKSENSSEKHRRMDKNISDKKDKHKSSSEKVSDRSKSKENSSKEKSSSSKEKSKDKSSSKEKEGSSSSSHSKSEKKHSSSRDKSDKNKIKSESKSKSERSSEKKSSHKSSSSEKRSSSSSKSKEDKPKIMVTVNTDSDDEGIGSQSGASFAEALGMVVPLKPKKKQSTTPIKDTFSPNSTGSSDLSPASLLAPSTKLAPLPALEISALPEISPHYKPRPPPKFMPHFTEEDLGAAITSKNQRTKVYSGNKIMGKVPTLYEMCVQILQEHIDALEYTGGVPYEILKPVVDKATPQQLFMLEHYNPYLMDDTDHLWQKHCERQFRNKKRQEMETWREMYMRCQEEQEHKLKSLTANIRMTQEAKKAPIKQTKMAYVDTVVKPPRNIARKQALHGTAHMATASPAARVAALAAQPNVLKGGVRAPPAAPVSHSAHNKPKKAPLMQKALQFMRGRKR